MSLCSCWCVTPWHKMMRSRQLASFCQLSQKRSKTHVLTKSLYIKTWFVCLNKFECFKNVETFQAPKHDSWCLPQICQQLQFWMPFRTLLSLSSLRDKRTKLLRSMSNKVPSSEVTKWILRSSHDSFVHFCDDSAGKTKAKHMENGLIFHVTIQIQILTMFSVQSKYSKKTKVYRCWVSSSPIKRAKYETCKYNVNHHGWAYHQGENKFILPMQKRPVDSSHHRCQIFTSTFSASKNSCNVARSSSRLLSVWPNTKAPPLVSAKSISNPRFWTSLQSLEPWGPFRHILLHAIAQGLHAESYLLSPLPSTQSSIVIKELVQMSRNPLCQWT